MTPFGDNPHQGDEKSAPVLLPFLLKQGLPGRSTTGKPAAIYRPVPAVESTKAHVVRLRGESFSDASLVFDAIHDDFQAQCTMVRAFAELRGDDGAEYLW